jgi:hypothetical protein
MLVADKASDTPTMLAGRAKVLGHIKTWLADVRVEKAQHSAY